MRKEPVRFDYLSFDRASCYPDGIAEIHPGKPSRRVTYAEVYARQHGAHRNDIAMLNCYDADGEHVGQKMVYPGSNGEPFGDAIPWLSKSQMSELREINRKMLELARQFPDYARAMRITP